MGVAVQGNLFVGDGREQQGQGDRNSIVELGRVEEYHEPGQRYNAKKHKPFSGSRGRRFSHDRNEAKTA